MYESHYARSPSPSQHRRALSMRSVSDLDLAGTGAGITAKDAEIQSLRRELAYRASSPSMGASMGASMAAADLYNLPTSPTMVMRQDKQIQDIKTEYEQAVMMRDMQIQNLRRELDHHENMCQAFEQQIRELKAELADRNAQVAQDIITASKRSVETNEAMKAKDIQIANLQKDIAERIALSQQEKITNQKALEAARAVFAADLDTALASAGEEKRRLEEEIRDYKERLGIFDEPPAVVEQSRHPSALRLSSAEIRLGNEIQVLKEHYGIIDDKSLDMDLIEDPLSSGSGDIDGLHLSSSSADEKLKSKKSKQFNKKTGSPSREITRHASSPMLRRKSSFENDDESSLSSVSSDSNQPREERKSSPSNRKKSHSRSPKRRQHTPSDQDDCTDNSTASAPLPTTKPVESPKPAAADEKKSNVKTPAEMCKLFGISSTAVFDGEMIKKKFSKDFMVKESFVWINPSARSIHWAKSATDKLDPKHSKFLLLKKSTVPEAAQIKLGEKKGVVKGVMKMPHNGGIMISTDEGEFLELKIPPESVANWAQVLRVLV